MLLVESFANGGIQISDVFVVKSYSICSGMTCIVT